jgi:hypothetical protein
MQATIFLGKCPSEEPQFPFLVFTCSVIVGDELVSNSKWVGGPSDSLALKAGDKVGRILKGRGITDFVVSAGERIRHTTGEQVFCHFPSVAEGKKFTLGMQAPMTF